MTTRTKSNESSDFKTRLTILEQSFIAFTTNQQLSNAKLDRLYSYVFGGEGQEDSLKSQVKELGEKVESLIKAAGENRDDKKKYMYLVISVVFSSSVSFVIGWVLSHLLPSP